MEEKEINFGYIHHDLTPNDYVFGSFTPVVKDIDNPNKLFLDYYSNGEVQIGIYFDTLACVIFSTRTLDAKFNWKKEHDLISKENLDWLIKEGYFDSNGYFNKSERFTAKMSGTTHSGNSADKVWDSIRKDGIIPESRWPFPNQQRTPVFDWDDYYAEIPQELIDLGKEFARRFQILYEYVPATKESILEVLQYSPVQIFVHAWPLIGTDGIYHKTFKAINHAVSIFGFRSENYIEIFDHYTQRRDLVDKEDFIKKLSNDYILSPYGVACYIKELTNKPKTMQIVNNKLYQILTPNGQHLGMGLDGKVVVYDNWAITLITSASRSGKYQIPEVVRLDQMTGVQFIDGKRNPITL